MSRAHHSRLRLRLLRWPLHTLGHHPALGGHPTGRHPARRHHARLRCHHHSWRHDPARGRTYGWHVWVDRAVHRRRSKVLQTARALHRRLFQCLLVEGGGILLEVLPTRREVWRLVAIQLTWWEIDKTLLGLDIHWFGRIGSTAGWCASGCRGAGWGGGVTRWWTRLHIRIPRRILSKAVIGFCYRLICHCFRCPVTMDTTPRWCDRSRHGCVRKRVGRAWLRGILGGDGRCCLHGCTAVHGSRCPWLVGPG